MSPIDLYFFSNFYDLCWEKNTKLIICIQLRIIYEV